MSCLHQSEDDVIDHMTQLNQIGADKRKCKEWVGKLCQFWEQQILAGICGCHQLTVCGVINRFVEMLPCQHVTEIELFSIKEAKQLVGQSVIGHKPKILIGHLSPAFPGLQNKFPGIICLKDFSGKIDVQIYNQYSRANLMVVDRLVVVTNWMVKHTSVTDICLEVLDAMYLMTGHTENVVHSTITCVVPESAADLMQHGVSSPSKPLYVNVACKISAVSEIIKVKDTCMFFIRLLLGTNIVVKKKELLYWQSFLVPHTKYLITYLRPTTLLKGSKHQCRVYTVTARSELLTDEGVLVNIVSTDDWLRQQEITSQDVYTYNKHTPVDSSDKQLFTYRGKITKVLDPVFGVFEMDNEVRLYIGQIPAAHKFLLLQVGVELIVHNAHYRLSKQCPKVTMYCCMLSCVKIVSQSSSLSVKNVHDSQTLQKYKFLYPLTGDKLEYIYHVRHTLCKQFKESLGQRMVEKLFSTIMSVSVLSWQQNADCNYRIHIDEFLHAPHDCSMQEWTHEKLPQYVSVREIIESVCSSEEPPGTLAPQSSVITGSCQYSRKESQGQILVGILDLSEKSGQPVIRDDTGAVTSVICCYHDNPVPTICHHGDKPHECSCSCTCDGFQSGECFPCHMLHTCCIGKIVAMVKFEIVCDWLNIHGPESSDTASKSADIVVKYICFNLKDVTILGNAVDVTMNRKVKNIPAEQGSSIDLPQDRCQSDNYVDELVKGKQLTIKNSEISDQDKSPADEFISEFDVKLGSTLYQHRKDDGPYFYRKAACSETSIFEKDVDIQLKVLKENKPATCVNMNSSDKKYSPLRVKPRLPSVSKRNCKDMIGTGEYQFNKNKQEKMFENDNPVNLLDKRLRTDINVANNPAEGNIEPVHVHNMETVVVYVVNREALMSDGQTHDQRSSRFCVECRIITAGDPQKKVMLLFQNAAVKWYSLIYRNAFYRLSVPCEWSPLLSSGLSNSKVEKVIHRMKSKLSCVVHNKVTIERIYKLDKERLNGKCDKGCTPISDLLTVDFAEEFVDIAGLLVSRSLVTPDSKYGQQYAQGYKSKYGFGGFESVCTKLQIQNLKGKDSIQVYLNHDSFCYPPGLVPGAVVCFTNLERKISKSGNIYCRYVPLSSVYVTCMTQQLSSKILSVMVGKSDFNPDVPLPKLCLVEMWDQPTQSSPTSTFQCVCDVLQVLKLSLKCVCLYCGSMVVRSLCTNVGCHGGEEADMLARASVIIDDSTSVAIVTLTGSCVQSMLQLSHDQWTCLKDEVNLVGEIFIQSRPTASLCSDTETFVYMLCNSRLTKQMWAMTLRQRNGSKATWDLNTINNDEFALKSFDTGSGRISTQCLPFLQLECLHMDMFNPSAWALHELN